MNSSTKVQVEDLINSSPSRLETDDKEDARAKAPPVDVESPFFTLDEAATYARCSRRQVQRWRDQGKLSHCGHGRKPLFLKEELRDLLTSGR